MMQMETQPLTEEERLVFDRVARTRLARASEVAHDLDLEPAKVLITLRSLKNRALLDEQRSGTELLSVYFVTQDGLAFARR